MEQLKPLSTKLKVSIMGGLPLIGGGKSDLSNSLLGRILFFLFCCLFSNNINIFAQNDWRVVQNFESSPAVKSCYSTNIKNNNNEASDVADYSNDNPQKQVIASISNNVGNNSSNVGMLSKNFHDNSISYGIVLVVSLGSNKLSDYTKIKLDTYTTNGNKPLSVYVRQSGTNNSFKKLFVLGNGFGGQGQWLTNGGQNSEQSITTTGMDYSDVEFYIGYSEAYEILDVYIDNIQLYGPAIGSSAIEIDETKNNTITAKDDATVNLTRSLVKDVWNTICLPFVPSSDQVIAIFGKDAKFAEFSSVSNGVMQFRSVAVGSLVAGTPYLVLPTKNLSTENPVALTGVNITATSPTTVEHDGYEFIGTYEKKSFANTEWETTRFVGTGNNLLKPNSTGALRSLRAYFTVPVPGVPGASGGAKNYTFAVDSFVPTSIANIQIEGDGDGAIYNIGGQRVEGKSLPKGIYIREGKKFVVK